ncbi:MAG: hypothetical protein CFE45_01110 [Burkholderiales bacterium PBB5]|nr:MAG: hypothetical protein CFE45_01110 [Burkholderiales bacterium PBB5]
MATANTAPNRVNTTALSHQGYGIHRDDFTISDQLDRRTLVRTLAEQIATDQAPLVVGLHGDWGSGKTSALRAMQYHLCGTNPHNEKLPADDMDGKVYSGHVVTVWFEAWRYQNEAVPVVALLQEMRRQLSTWRKGLTTTQKLATVAAESLLDGLDKAAKLIGLESLPLAAKDIRSTGERYEREHLEQSLPTDTVQEFLKQTIQNLLPDQVAGLPTPRLVVFIDDLDRCSSESAYRLLEGLKIYLQLDNCVFVLGMNQQVVVEAIAERLKKDDADRAVVLRAEAYLEKLCSNIWRLPLPRQPVVYFASLVDNEAARSAIESACSGTPPCPSFLPPNPRRLRALANPYNRLLASATAALQVSASAGAARYQQLLVVAYFYQFHSEIYQRWHYDSNFLLRLRSWLNGSLQADDKTEPHLARLILPTQVLAGDPSSPVPVHSVESRYPDPAAPGILWIAPLLQITLANATPGDFDPLLKLAF